jgi:hypothetical protein
MDVMDESDANLSAQYQKQYRKSQAQSGLIRYEIQIPAQTKHELEELVSAAAQEYPQPHSLKQREAKARAQIFTELTAQTRHEFFELKDRIACLEE